MQFVSRDYVYERNSNLMQPSMERQVLLPNTIKSRFGNMAINVPYIGYLINRNDPALNLSYCDLLKLFQLSVLWIGIR